MGPLYYTILIAIFLIVLGIIFFKKRDNNLKEDTDPLNIDPESEKDEPILRSRPTGPTSRTMSPKVQKDHLKDRRASQDSGPDAMGNLFMYNIIAGDSWNLNDQDTQHTDSTSFGNGGSFSGGGASSSWGDESDSDSSSSDSYDSDSSDSSSDD